MDYETIENILHTILSLELFFGIIMWIIWAIKNKKSRNYALSPILFFLHALLFLILSLTGIIYGEILQVWADLVAIHGITVIICGVYVMINSLNREI